MGSHSYPTEIKYNPLYSKQSITSSLPAPVTSVPFRAVPDPSTSANHWFGCRNFPQLIVSSWKLSVFEMFMATHFWRDELSFVACWLQVKLFFITLMFCRHRWLLPGLQHQLLPPVHVYFMSPEMFWQKVELCQKELFLLFFMLAFFSVLAASEEGECCSCGKEKLPKLLCRVMTRVHIYNCPGAVCQLCVLGSLPTNSSHCFWKKLCQSVVACWKSADGTLVATKVGFMWALSYKDSWHFFKLDVPCETTPRHPPCALWDRPTVSFSLYQHFSATSVGTRPSC